MDFTSLQFYLAVLQIITIDVMLGGDNAVVIALACRRLPDEQRKKGIIWGVVGAIILRILLIFFALQLLALPYLKITGALLLAWIGIKLLQPEESGHDSVEGSANLFGAIKTIIVADVVMSMDNVIAVAGAAKGGIVLVVFGILCSVPIIVWGSSIVLRLMDRFPIVITLGGGLLGWIAGEMLITDKALQPWLHGYSRKVHYISAVSGAVFVLVTGKLLAMRASERKHQLVDLALQQQTEETSATD